MSRLIDRLLDSASRQEDDPRPVQRMRLPSVVGWGLIVLVVAIYLATGIYTVGASEEALVKRFGRYVRSTGPGIHYRLPAPFEQVITVDVRQVRNVEIGFRTISPAPNPRYQSIISEAQMLTGDGNITHVEMAIQYRVKDAPQLAFHLISPHTIVKQAAEAMLREEVATRTLDETLTELRDVIGINTMMALQALLDLYGAGISIDNVQLQAVKPPVEVVSAFDDVNSARQDKEKLINESERYAMDIVPRARGQAQEIANQADAYKQTRTKGAEGDVARFREVLARYSVGEEVTRTRLYIETMETILPGMEKILISEDTGGILKLLSLDGAGGELEQ
jgi:modulator of FtsH protease HflK